MVQRVKNFVLWAGVVGSFVLLIFIFFMRDRYTVPILTYHNVSASYSPLLLNNVTPKSFDHQMKFLYKHGYHVISLHDFVKGHRRGLAFQRNTVVITFDDGYEDSYANAYPILKKFDFSATAFVITDKIGTPGFLTWAQVKEMDDNDFSVEAHTRTHAYLPDLSLEAAREEIVGSKRILEQKLGHKIKHFAYPSGGFTEETQTLVKQAGYKAAFTTNRGRDIFNRDMYALRRIRPKNGDNALVLWAKLSGYYNLFRKSKDGY